MRAITEPHLGTTAESEPDSAVAIARPSPKSGYALTLADVRKGRAVQAARQRERKQEARKTALDRLAEKLEAEADTILATYMAAIRDGDWRAAEALYDRVYGKATQRQEIEDVTEREAITDEQIAELRALEAEQKRRRAA